MIKYIKPTSRTVEFQADKTGELIYYIPNTERAAFLGLGVLTGAFVVTFFIVALICFGPWKIKVDNK